MRELGLTHTSPNRKELFEIYRIAVEEYRFNVELGWNRTKYLLTLNSSLTVAGLALFRFAEEKLDYVLLSLVFFLSLIILRFSFAVTRTAKQYYYNAKYKKAYIENRLGLFDNDGGETDPRANLAITTTNDQMYRQQLVVVGTDAEDSGSETDFSPSSGVFRALREEMKNLKILSRRAPVSGSLDMILVVIGAINFIGMMIALVYVFF